MEQQAFMTSFEQDAKERAARRLIRQKEGAVVKEQGNKAFKCKDYVQAEELYTKALSLWSDHLPLYTNRALVRLKLHRYQDALSDCDWALRLHDRHPKALNHQGVAYAALHDYEAAITSLTKAKRASTGAARTTIQATLDRVAKEQEQWEHAKAARQALDQNEDEDVRQIVAQVTAMMTSDDNVTSDVRVITGWDLTQADGQRKLIAMEQACRDFEQTCQQITTVYSNLDDSKTAVASRVFYISLPDLFLAKSNVISLYLSALDESIASLTLLARSSVTALLRLLDRIEQRTAWSDIAQDVYQSAAVQQRLAQLLSSKEALVGLSAGCLLQRLALEVPKVLDTEGVMPIVWRAAFTVEYGTDRRKTSLITLGFALKEDGIEVTQRDHLDQLISLTQPSQPEVIRSVALDAMVSWSHHRGLRTFMATNNMLQPLIAITASALEENNNDIIQPLLGCLCNLGLDDRLRQQLQTSELLTAVCEHVPTATARQARIHAVSLLARLTTDADVVRTLIAANWHVMLRKLLKKQDKELVAECARALAKLVSYADKTEWISDRLLTTMVDKLDVAQVTTSGNLALAIGDACVKAPCAASALTKTDVVVRLLELAKMDAGPAQKNAALALARLAKSDEAHLTQLRALGGFEVLRARA
eukprot:TRINITY_DN7198_c0_g1_i1.p1 TRINITY_DN7198_c0_g1~~TRINITY_DN7198_c0_g1_i1.p1  ORF type:complete len:737 (+),score=174.29 TRINITY_DN7198_c0_g1_i1:269-2212(+)